MAETDNMVAHSSFSDQLASMQDKYYRSIRLENWIEMGIAEEDISSTMSRLKADEKGQLVDVNNPNTKGHWTYEFTLTAKRLEAIAMASNSPKAYDRASAAYLVASYPNLNRPNEILAMEKAVDMYLKAAEIRGENVEKVTLQRFDRRGIAGLLHMPKNVSNKVPAMIWTGGVDKTLIEHKKDFEDLLERGYAILTLDMPGGGLDYKNHLKIGEETVSHDAAMEFLQNHPMINKERIGAFGSSGSGISLLPFAIVQPQLKAVVARCALVDGPIKNEAKLRRLPKMSAHSLAARIGADVGDMGYLNLMAPKFSLANKALLDGQARTNTPILAINTKKDPVAPIKDVQSTAKLSTKGEVFISDEFGHCPDSDEAKSKILEFILSNV